MLTKVVQGMSINIGLGQASIVYHLNTKKERGSFV